MLQIIGDTYCRIVDRDGFQVVLKMMTPCLTRLQLVHFKQIICKNVHATYIGLNNTTYAVKIYNLRI